MHRKRHTHRRGRTRQGRLILLDQLLKGQFIALPTKEPFVAVDIGFGDEPVTTLELHAVLAQAFPSQQGSLRVIGVESEAARVQRAQKSSTSSLEFVQGSFDLNALGLSSLSLIRCFNVLRGYSPEQGALATRQMTHSLGPGGLLLEGTSDTEGHLVSAHLWRKDIDNLLFYEGLLCVSDMSRGFAPRMFGDVLPRSLRRNVKPGERIYDWLTHWQAIVDEVRKASPTDRCLSPEQVRSSNQRTFEKSVTMLSQQRADTCLNPALFKQGAVVWTPYGRGPLIAE